MKRPRRILFGAGTIAGRHLHEAQAHAEIVAFADNDSAKWGKDHEGISVVPPQKILELQWDEIEISCTATYPVFRQLVGMGVPPEKIVAPLLSPDNLRNWRHFEGLHRGRRLFIVGNGPSLRLSDLELLHSRRELSFAFNKIYLAFSECPYRPTYYLVEDDWVAKNNAARIRGLSGPAKFFPDYLLPILGPPDASTTLFYFSVQSPHSFEPRLSTEPLLLHSGYSCTFSAIQLGLWLGFSEIILIGVDFSFSVPPPEIDGSLSYQGEQNHFLPGYRSPGERWNPPYLEQTEKAYTLARKVAEERGVKIYNATRGGCLEVFERVSFDSLFP